MTGRFWNASWISLSQHPRDDLGCFAFRRRFSTNSPIKVRVSADQRFRLYLNGELVGVGPTRGDQEHWRYEAFELEPVVGENTLLAVVWSFGRYAPMAQMTARLGFILEGEGISTPGGWEAARIPCEFEMLTAEMEPAYFVVGPNEIQNGQAWNSWGDADLDWRKPNVIGPGKEEGSGAGDSLWWLEPSPLPPMRHDLRDDPGLIVLKDDRRDHFEPVELEAGEELLLDMSELLCAYPVVEFESAKAGWLSIAYSEALYDPSKPRGPYSSNKGDRDVTVGKEFRGHADRVDFQPGAGTFEPLWWRTYRYLRLKASQPIKIKAIQHWETGYPLKIEGSFTSDWRETKPLWDTSLRTLLRCMGETYFDCPFYEQLQYVGDTRIQTMINRFLSRDRRLIHNAIDQFAWSQIDAGLTQSRYPGREMQVIPGFSLWWIMMLRDQHFYDLEPIRPLHLKIAREILKCWREQLLVEPEKGGYWCFADWTDGWGAGEPPGGVQSGLHRALLAMAENALAEIEGRTAPNGLAEFKRGADGLYRHPDDPSQAPTEHLEALLRVAFPGECPPWPELPPEVPRCTYWFSWYRHQAMNPDDWTTVYGPWLEMIANGLSTFAEMPEPSRSDCHAWSAHPILGMMQGIAGISSIAPHWAKARIAPRLGSVQSFQTTVPHPAGDLSVGFDKGLFRLQSPVPFEFAWDGRKKDLPAGAHEVRADTR